QRRLRCRCDLTAPPCIYITYTSVVDVYVCEGLCQPHCPACASSKSQVWEEPSRHGARQLAEQKTVGSNRFHCLQPRSMTVADEGCQPACLPRLALPGVGNCAST